MKFSAMKTMMNHGLALTKAALTYGSNIGLVQGEHEYTWRQLEDNANALAHALLEIGLTSKERVIVQCPNNRYIFESHYAILRAGGVYSPINFRASSYETISMVDRCRAVAIITTPEYREHVRSVVEQSPRVRYVIFTGSVDEAAQIPGVTVLIYDELVARYLGRPTVNVTVSDEDACWHKFSSGTTGVPKGIVTTNGSLAFITTGRVLDVMPGLDHTHATLAMGPLSHGTGTIVTCNVLRAAKTVMLPTAKFEPATCLRLIAEQRITSMFTIPTMLVELLKHPAAETADLSSLKHVIYAGAPIARIDQELLIHKLGHALYQYYGQAENMGTATYLPPHMHSLAADDPSAPPGSCGVARTGVEVAVFDAQMRRLPVGEVGELATRSLANFAGYYEMPEESQAVLVDGWLRSGDLARVDENGFHYIVGRIKEMYKSGGLQVYPNETQDILMRHPAVEEAHVLSLPDSKWGEIGIAIVKPKNGQAVTEDELLAHVSSYLARYKIPRRVYVWDDVPRSAVGKVPKALLRQELFLRTGLVEGEDVPVAPRRLDKTSEG